MSQLTPDLDPLGSGPQPPAPEQAAPDYAPRVRAALDVAREAKLDPDYVSRSVSIARNLNLPVSVIAADLNYARREVMARKIEQNPLLADWAGKNEFNAAVVSGDEDGLTNLFDAVQKDYERRKRTRPEMGILPRVNYLLDQGAEDVINSIDDFITGSIRYFSTTEFIDADGNPQTATSRVLTEWADLRESQPRFESPPLEAQTKWGQYLQDIVRQSPQIVSQVAMALWAGPLVAMPFMGAQIAGSQYHRLTQGGTDPARAYKAGITNALMQTPLEYIGALSGARIFSAKGLKNIAKRSLESIFFEGATEFLQEYPESGTDIWAQLGQNEGAKVWFDRFLGDLDETTQRGLYAAAVVAPFGLFGGVSRAMYENGRAKTAEAFAQGQIDLHEQVEAALTSNLDPAIMESALEAAGMREEVGIDANALMQMHQAGRDVIDPLELELEDVRAAALAGQDITLPLASLHARLRREDFNALMEHARENPEAITRAETLQVDERVAQDAARIAELYQDNRNLFDELEAEKARLKEEMRNAIATSPNLTAQVEANGGFDKYADNILNLVERYAWRMGIEQSPVETIRKITFDEIYARERARQSQQAQNEQRPEQKQTEEERTEETAEAIIEENIGQDLTDLSAAPEAEDKIIGRETKLFNNDLSENARYEVWEMDDVIASHDPENLFKRRENYPEQAQERPYHSDLGEQEKVLANAAKYEPERILTNNTTASEGPPIITQDGIVLGGNSRTMTLQMVYAKNPEKAAQYRQTLETYAPIFGIDAAKIAGMRRPILVRAVDGEMSLDDMAVRSRLYNQTGTQKLQAKAEGVSRARLISAETIAMLGNRMEDFDTLRQFFESPKSRDFVRRLLDDGVIERTEFSSMTDKEGKLNDAGKTLVENALRGLIVPNYDILESCPPAILQKLDRAIPYLVQLKSKGGQWDLGNVLMPALQYLTQAARNGREIGEIFGQADLLDNDPNKKRPAVQALAMTLGRATQKETASRLEIFASAAMSVQEDMGMLTGMTETTPAQAFIKAFMRPIVSVDNTNISGFDPANNELHKALQWAYEHGGSKHSVTTAIKALEKILVGKENTQSEKDDAREMIATLAPYSGEIRIQQPKLGEYFHYKEGMELFQDELNTAEAKLQRDVAAWEKNVDDLKNNIWNMRQGMTILTQTPLVMQMVGARDLPIEIAPGKLKKAMREHNLSWEVIKKVPAALADPIMIFQSQSQGGDLLLMLSIKDAENNGATVNVPIALNLTDQRGYEANIATTVFGRRKGRTGLPDNQWFANQVGLGNLLYRNRQKSRDWARTSGVQFPGANSRSKHGIRKIYTDEDLVNLKKAHPGFYQDEHNPRGSVQIYPESYLISLFDKSDMSTVIHETGHVFFEELERLVKAGAQDATLVSDYNELRNWVGAESAADLSIEQREQIARGFEAYLMEGKAPAPELSGAFARFRKWLTRIYKSALGLNVELTDEVRQVFSRMISSEQEVNRAFQENMLIDLAAREIEALGLSDEEAAQIRDVSETARLKAADALQAMRNENRRERLKRYAREAAEELDNERTYQARKNLRKTPLDLETVKNGFGQELANSLRKKLIGSVKKEGMDPEIFAAEHGYRSADEMFRDILDSKTKADAIRELVAQKEAEYDQKYSALETMLDTEDVATQMDLVGRKLADLVGVQQIARAAYAIAAQEELGRTKIGSAIQTGRYLAAMRRNMRQYRQALFAGDRESALRANRKALLNYEFARQSRALAKETQKFSDAVKRFTKSNSVGADAKFIVNQIAAAYGLARENAALSRGRDYKNVLPAWLADVKAEGFDAFLDDNVILMRGGPWRDLSTTDYEALVDTITQITTVERNRHKLLTARGKLELQAVADEIAKSVYAHNRTRAVHTVQEEPKAVQFLEGLHAIHTKVEALCLAVDGDKMGPAWEYIYKPITEAEDVQAGKFKEAAKKLKEIFSVYSRRELTHMGSRREFVPEIGESLTWENRLSLALNMGNAVNIERIKAGHGWDDGQIAAILTPLTARDWNFVQSVWDYLDTFKGEAFALQQELTGIRPKEVEAQPLTVLTADGQTLNLNGGYYPIAYNPKKGERAFEHDQKKLDEELFGGRNYGSANTQQGHLRERASQGLGTPLLLNVGVITDHIFNVIHDISYRKAVLDVAKVIRNATVRKAFTDTVGRQMYHQLMPWLQDIANERQEPMNAINRWAHWARTSTSIMQMGYKVTTMVMQPFGITQTMDVIGYKWTAYGIGKVFGNATRLPALLQETYARSPFMQNRISSFDREVRDITRHIKPGMGRFGWLEVIKDKAFVPMGMFQMSVDLPTWWGAYAKGLQENGGDEIRAAQYADSIVRTSQGGGSTKDLARVQRGSELARLFTLFYSYFNTFYNLGARHIRQLRDDHSPAGILRAANAALLLWFVPAVLTEIAAGRGPDDDEDWWKWSAPLLIQYPFQAVIGVRDLVSGIFGAYGYQITAAQSAPASFVKWADSVKKAIEKEDATKMVKPTAEAVGYAMGLPLKQPIITAQNMWDWLTGDDPEFYVRDLFFPKPKSRRD